MKIPESFKIGTIEFDVKFVDKIKDTNDGSMVFGQCDPTSQIITIATKDLKGNELSEARKLATFYHELAHVLVGETGEIDLNSDEVFIEALSKNIFSFIDTVKY